MISLGFSQVLSVGAIVVMLVVESSIPALSQNLVMTPVLSASVGKHPDGLTSGDFNHDGHLDIATANSDSDDVTILLGNGNGTFQAGVSFGVGRSPLFLTAGLINQDEWLDLVVAETGGDRVLVLLGRGNGLFHSPASYPSGKGPTFLALGDLDGDQDVDVVAVNSGRFGNYPPFSLSVLLNQGDGRLGQAKTLVQNGQEGLFPTGVSLSDVNGDGLSDLAVTWSQPSWRTPDGMVKIFLNEGAGNFSFHRNIDVGATLSAVHQVDLDEDGQVDLVASSVFTDSLMVLLQEGKNRYTKPAQQVVGFSPVAITSGDLDGDGRLDLVSVNRASNSISVLLGMDYGTFRAAGHYNVGLAPTALDVSDFNEDGIPDIVTANSGSDDISILLSGKSGIPSLTLSAESLQFNSADPLEGTTHSVTLSNVGLAPLMISQVYLESSNPDVFELEEAGCTGHILKTGTHCVIEVRLATKTPGIHHALLKVWDNAPGAPHEVILRGVVKGQS